MNLSKFIAQHFDTKPACLQFGTLIFILLYDAAGRAHLSKPICTAESRGGLGGNRAAAAKAHTHTEIRIISIASVMARSGSDVLAIESQWSRNPQWSHNEAQWSHNGVHTNTSWSQSVYEFIVHLDIAGDVESGTAERIQRRDARCGLSPAMFGETQATNNENSENFSPVLIRQHEPAHRRPDPTFIAL